MAKQKLKDSLEQALANPNLRGALGRFGDAYLEARAKAYEHKDFITLREQIAGLKGRAAADMDQLAQKFARAAQSRGAVVYRAETASDAREYIFNLARQKGVRTIVKSKSMASEEIHLNQFLNTRGLESVETDLGEWILQLSGQKPSHMVMPAIHMTRGEVADVFAQATGTKLDPDIPELVRVARERLRQKFLTADMGITGANIAIAETGTLVLLTNEGNARLVTTLPPVHVALVGLEKLVASFADAQPIIEALPRSATGQKITSYVNIITGPTPVLGPNDSHPSRELHIVLLDNGRTAMRDNPIFQEALQCIRCASCLNVCPVFQVVGGHVYGYVYTGGIGTILTAFFNGLQNAGEIQNLCLGCEKCKQFCPGKIDIPRLIRELRSQLTQQSGRPALPNYMLSKVFSDRRLFYRLLKIARLAQKPFQSGSVVRHLPLFFAGLTEGRSLPVIDDKPFRDRIKDLQPPVGAANKNYRAKEDPDRSKIGIFAGCLTDFVYPRLGESVLSVLDQLGFETVFPGDQSCCGVPALYLGSTATAADLARQNIAALEDAGVGQIVTACPTCAYTLRLQYPELLAGDEAWRQRSRKLATKVRHITDFAAGAIKEREQSTGISFSGPTLKAAYHDSCHLKGCLGITVEPRKMLAKAGLKVVEMDRADNCCGFGGSYTLKFPELSRRILDKKLSAITKSGADIVALDCPGCFLQISGGLDQMNQMDHKIHVKHTVEIMAERIKLLRDNA